MEDEEDKMSFYAIEGDINVASEIGVVLPTYCEAANIEKLMCEIEELKLNLSILVIDDSSPDGTVDIVRRLQTKHDNILLLVRPRKNGLGTAITDGFKIFLSLEHPPRNIVTMDADFSHNPKDLTRLVHTARNGYDLVIGGRYCKGGKIEKWSPFRILVSKIANVVASTVIGARIPDSTSGLRCYSSRLLQSIVGYLHSTTYEIQIETVRQTTRAHFKVAFLPITFANRKMGKSKLSLNEVKQFLRYIVKAKIEDLERLL